MLALKLSRVAHPVSPSAISGLALVRAGRHDAAV